MIKRIFNAGTVRSQSEWTGFFKNHHESSDHLLLLWYLQNEHSDVCLPMCM